MSSVFSIPAFEDKIFLTSSYTRMLELVACILTPHRFRVLYICLTKLITTVMTATRKKKACFSP